MSYINNFEKAEWKEEILQEISSSIDYLYNQKLLIEQRMMTVIQSEFEPGYSSSIDQANILGQEAIVSIVNAIWQLENASRKIKNLGEVEYEG